MANDQSNYKYKSAKNQPKKAHMGKEMANLAALTAEFNQRYDHLPFPCFLLDRFGNIIAVNSAEIYQLGYTVEELKQTDIFSLIYWPNFSKKNQLINWLNYNKKQHNIQDIIAKNYELNQYVKPDCLGQICSKNNQCFWFKIIPVVIQLGDNESDKESYKCLICQDVTNFHLEHQSHAIFLDELMQMTQDVILYLDAEGKIRRFSQTFLELSGYEAKDLQEKSILTVLDTGNNFQELGDWQWYQSLFTKEETLVNGTTEHSTAKFIHSIICKNGSKVEIFWTIHGVKNSATVPWEWIWFGQTVFNYIPEVSATLTQADQKISVKPSLENFADAVAVFDKNYRYIYINSAMKEALNLENKQVIGKTNKELNIPEKLKKFWEDNLAAVVQTGKTVEDKFLFPLEQPKSGEARKLQKNKSQKNKFVHQWYEVCWLPLWGSTNSVDWIFTIARKISHPLADRPVGELAENSLSEYAQKTIESHIQIYFENLDWLIRNAEDVNLDISKKNLIIYWEILNKEIKKEVANKHRLEKALQENQERLNLIINTNADGLMILDKVGNILFINTAGAAIFGRPKKDLIGKWLGRPIITHEITELEILLPNLQVAIAQMQVVEIPWTQVETYTQNCLIEPMTGEEKSSLKVGQEQDKRDSIAYLSSLRDVTEQKQAFDRLLWMQQAIESASDAIAIANRTGEVVYQNPAFGQLFEYKDCQEINQLNPSPDIEVFTSSNYPKFLSNLLRHSPLISPLFTDKKLAEEVLKCVRNGQSWQGEVTMQSQTGKVMQIALKADTIENYPGHIIGLICTYTNVTERRKAEEMLRISWAQNQAMFETIPDMLCRMSKDGTYLECSENSATKFYHNLSDYIGKNCQEILPYFLAKEQMAAIAKALETKKVQVFEYQLVLPGENGENSLYDYEARVAAIDDHEVLTMVRDVSDKAEVQRSLKESEERYRTLTETSQDMIFIFNRDTSINYVNTFAAHKLGSDPEKLIGKSVQEIFPRPLAAELANKIYQVLRSKTQITLEEKLDLKCQPIWLHFSLVPLRNEAGILTAVLAVARNITERIQGEAALKESQEKLRQSEQQLIRTLATAPIGIATCDLNGDFKSVNPALCEMLGYFALDLRKMSLGDLVPECDRSRFQTWINIFSESNLSQSQKEYTLIRKDGSEIIATIRVALVRDPQEKALQLVATIEDITERKRSQEQLLLLSKAVESASDAIAITDCHGRSTYHNPAFIQLFGFSAAELATVGGLPILYRDPDIALEVFSTIFQEGSWQGEVEMLSYRGIVRQIFLRTDAIQDATGEIIAFLGIYRDITDRKQAIDALAESEERFRTLADTAPVLIWLADPYGNYTFFNQTWLQFTGRTLEQEQGQGWMNQMHPEDFDHCLQEYLRAIEQEEAFRLLYRLRRSDGEYRWLLNTGVARKTPAGNLAGYIGCCIDISDRKELEEKLAERAKQLEQSNAELEQFAYVASHDLQEPLRTIASYTQLLAKRYEGKLDEKADKYIHYVVDGAQRMQTLIDDLLKYSRVSTRRQEFQPVNCQEIFEQAIAHLKVAIRQASAEIFIDPSCPCLPTVLGDETQLIQLFQNLISNAIKYRQPEVRPIIKIAAKPWQNHWLFAIEDNGIGIDPQNNERIFLIFQRLHTRNEYPGTGIGLAVCHKIVERHQGRIWVESQLGQGSTFYFTLPQI